MGSQRGFRAISAPNMARYQARQAPIRRHIANLRQFLAPPFVVCIRRGRSAAQRFVTNSQLHGGGGRTGVGARLPICSQPGYSIAQNMYSKIKIGTAVAA